MPAIPSELIVFMRRIMRLASPIATVRPEKTTARPAVSSVLASASGTGCSRISSRKRVTTNSE